MVHTQFPSLKNDIEIGAYLTLWLDNSSKIGVVLCDSSAIIRYINPHATALLGITESNQTELFKVLASVLDSSVQLDNIVAELNQHQQVEFGFSTTAPLQRYLICHLSYLPSEVDNQPACVLMMYDQNDREQGEHSLAAYHEWLQRMIDNVPCAVLSFSLTGQHPPGLLKPLMVSHAVHGLTGFTAEQWQGNSERWLQQIHPEDKTRALRARSSLISNSKVDIHYRLQHQDGTWLYLWEQLKLVQHDLNTPGEVIGLWINMTERHYLEEMIPQQETTYLRAMFQAETAMVITLSREGRVLNMNPAGLKLAEVEQMQNVVGREFVHLVQLSERDRFKRMHERILNGVIESMTYQLVGMKGSVHWIESRSSPVMDGQGAVIAHLCIAQDITQLKIAKDQLRKLSSAVENSPNAVFITDTQGVIEYVNTRFAEITGFNAEEATGNSARLLHSGETPEEVYEDMWQTVYGGQIWRGEVRHRRKDGSVYWAAESVSPISDEYGVITHFVSVHQDVTEARQRSDQSHYHASHDNLTGLVNRREFESRITRIVDAQRKQPAEHVLCVLDLDRFKRVNDVSGHAAGDELLRQISRVLQQSVRRRDTVARLGGDEFVVLMEHCSAERGAEVAKTIIENINQFRFLWEDKSFEVGVSIGLLPILSHAPIDDLLKQADSACYAAKNAGRNRVCVYRSEHQIVFAQSGESVWVKRIGRALKEDSFELYAQTIKPLSSHSKIRFCEILIRMRSRKGTVILPGAFFPIAERYNLIAQIDRWVVTQILDWMAAQNRLLPLCSINLSGASISDASFEKFIRDQLNRYPGMELADKLCFEISETLVIANLSDAIRFTNRVKQLGCSVCLDDFGSGLSSFSYLKSLPVDYLKIGGSFVKGMDDDPVQEAIVQSVNHIGRMMGRQTIAECVENLQMLDRLKQVGVDFAQGHAISKPRLLHRVSKS